MLTWSQATPYINLNALKNIKLINPKKLISFDIRKIRIINKYKATLRLVLKKVFSYNYDSFFELMI